MYSVYASQMSLSVLQRKNVGWLYVSIEVEKQRKLQNTKNAEKLQKLQKKGVPETSL